MRGFFFFLLLCLALLSALSQIIESEVQALFCTKLLFNTCCTIKTARATFSPQIRANGKPHVEQHMAQEDAVTITSAERITPPLDVDKGHP